VAQFESAHPEWRKSTSSATSNCVEVAFTGESVLIRHSRDESGLVLVFSQTEWAAFLTGVRNGEFDHHPD
jgi:hypothetical protein